MTTPRLGQVWKVHAIGVPPTIGTNPDKYEEGAHLISLALWAKALKARTVPAATIASVLMRVLIAVSPFAHRLRSFGLVKVPRNASPAATHVARRPPREDNEEMGDIASTQVRQGRAICTRYANISWPTTRENTKTDKCIN
jgi:hypothetical protein